jgi:hypothetical protein
MYLDGGHERRMALAEHARGCHQKNLLLSWLQQV